MLLLEERQNMVAEAVTASQPATATWNKQISLKNGCASKSQDEHGKIKVKSQIETKQGQMKIVNSMTSVKTFYEGKCMHDEYRK